MGHWLIGSSCAGNLEHHSRIETFHIGSLSDFLVAWPVLDRRDEKPFVTSAKQVLGHHSPEEPRHNDFEDARSLQKQWSAS